MYQGGWPVKIDVITLANQDKGNSKGTFANSLTASVRGHNTDFGAYSRT